MQSKRPSKEQFSQRNDDWTEDLYDHPVVTPKVYAENLLLAAQKDIQSSFFESLLSKADLGDLNALDLLDEEFNFFRNYNSDFEDAVKSAMILAKPAGTRLQGPLERVKMTNQVLLNELPGASVPKVIIDIISSYMAKLVKVEVEGGKKKKRKERDEPEITRQDAPKITKDKTKNKKKGKKAKRKIGGEK